MDRIYKTNNWSTDDNQDKSLEQKLAHSIIEMG